jgi:ribosomal protein S18 acetylase RimI-like enzyme
LPERTVRAPEPEEARAVAELLYLSSPGGFDFFGGGRRGGLRLIETAFVKPDTDSSREVVTVVEIEGRLAGAMAAFPQSEAETRRWGLVRHALRRRAPWHWPAIRRMGREGASATPKAPEDAFYIDALATSPDFRRRGVARALLEEAERRARAAGLPWLALDTTAANEGARRLYESYGFEVGEERPARPPIPALVGYVKRLGEPPPAPPAEPR